MAPGWGHRQPRVSPALCACGRKAAQPGQNRRKVVRVLGSSARSQLGSPSAKLCLIRCLRPTKTLLRYQTGSMPASTWAVVLLLSPSVVAETPQISFQVRFYLFPGLPCSYGGKNETCTFVSIFQVVYKFSFPFH